MAQGRASMLQQLWDYSWDREGWQPPLADALKGVGPAEAAWRPAGGGNTIRQTLNHLNHYDDGLLARLTGATPPPEAPDNDATFGDAGDPGDAAGWQAALDRRARVAGGLRAALAGLAEDDLERPDAGGGTLGDGLTAWVLHNAYHTGQIILIRKQQGSWPARR